MPNVCEIRHSGHYELMCKDCASQAIRDFVPDVNIPLDQVPDLFNIQGTLTKRQQACYPNLTRINETQ